MLFSDYILTDFCHLPKLCLILIYRRIQDLSLNNLHCIQGASSKIHHALLDPN